MGKILTAFADENLVIDPIFYKGNAEYQKALSTVYKLSEELEEKLNEEEKKKFEQFRDANEILNHIYARDRFSDGYRLGVLMTAEVYIENSIHFHSDEVK